MTVNRHIDQLNLTSNISGWGRTDHQPSTRVNIEDPINNDGNDGDGEFEELGGGYHY